jgi:hypothetical protein
MLSFAKRVLTKYKHYVVKMNYDLHVVKAMVILSSYVMLRLSWASFASCPWCMEFMSSSHLLKAMTF